MEDPVSITLATFNREAARLLRQGPDPRDGDDHALVERFLMRTGRPVPHVLVLGREPAAPVREIDARGGAGFGLDSGDAVIALAHRTYPGGHFVRGDPRNPPLRGNALDGAWLGGMLSHVPRDAMVSFMRGIHRALRPGALLYACLPTGATEGFEETTDGRLYHAGWDEQGLAQTLSGLDFDLNDRAESGGAIALTFRREY
jgi:SAM-dependent methyltransferase